MARRKSYTQTYSRSYIQAAEARAENAARPYATGAKKFPAMSPSSRRKYGLNLPPDVAAQTERSYQLGRSGVQTSGVRGLGTTARANVYQRKISPDRQRGKISGAKLTTRRRFNRDAKGQFT